MPASVTIRRQWAEMVMMSVSLGRLVTTDNVERARVTVILRPSVVSTGIPMRMHASQNVPKWISRGKANVVKTPGAIMSVYGAAKPT